MGLNVTDHEQPNHRAVNDSKPNSPQMKNREHKQS